MKRIRMFSMFVISATMILTAGIASAEDASDFRITFEWSSYPTLTIRNAPTADSVVLSIDIEHLPVHRVPGLLSDITAQGAVDVATVKMFKVNRKEKHAAITFTLQPIARSATSKALQHLHNVLNLREITIDASLSTLSGTELIQLLRPADSRPPSQQLRNELNEAINGALPGDTDEHGWMIEIQGYHYFDEQPK